MRTAEQERADVLAYLRTVPRVAPAQPSTSAGVLISITSSQDIARLADAIERGDHVRALEPAPTQPHERAAGERPCRWCGKTRGAHYMNLSVAGGEAMRWCSKSASGTQYEPTTPAGKAALEDSPKALKSRSEAK